MPGSVVLHAEESKDALLRIGVIRVGVFWWESWRLCSLVLLLLPLFLLAFSGPGFSVFITDGVLCRWVYVELSWKVSIWAASNNSGLPGRHKGNRNVLVCPCLCMCVLKKTHVCKCTYIIHMYTRYSRVRAPFKWEWPQLERRSSSCWRTNPHALGALIAVLQDGERLSSRPPSDDSCHGGGWMWRIHLQAAGSWEGCGAQNNSRMRSCQRGVWVDKYNHAALSFQGNYS